MSSLKTRLIVCDVLLKVFPTRKDIEVIFRSYIMIIIEKNVTELYFQ